MIDISLFGTTRVRTPQRVLEFTDFGGAKPRQILEILCLRNGRPISPEALAGMLWDGPRPAGWPATLYSYVALLRRVLQPGTPGRLTAVRTTSAGYLLDTTAVQTDLQRFDAAMAEAGRSEPAAALALVQQACALAAHGLLEHEPYLRWAAQARTEWHGRVLDAALRGARLALRLHRPDEAVQLAHRATQVDPFAEDGWQALIEGLGRAGRGAEARRAFRLCENRLRELGERPSGHTRRLLEDASAVPAGI